MTSEALRSDPPGQYKCIISKETIQHGQAPLLVTRSERLAELEETAEYRDAS
ncbi:MAG TPA: hypothetical protein VFA49_16000 [Chloroflexota bacterium]|nr:hypothetical protein [Chloroflexota bacterium]